NGSAGTTRGESPGSGGVTCCRRVPGTAGCYGQPMTLFRCACSHRPKGAPGGHRWTILAASLALLSICPQRGGASMGSLFGPSTQSGVLSHYFAVASAQAH